MAIRQTWEGSSMRGFLEALRIQRWDDHRYYHHSRINQSLHLLSAISFLTAYGLIFKNPAASALIGWLVAMVSRQAGHFFFEPKGYDEVNHATHEHKEDIKVGYNLRRKIVLLSIWALSPALLWLSPTLFGIFPRLRRSRHLHSARRPDLAGCRFRRSTLPHRASVLHQGRPDRAGLDDENPHRSVSRLHALLSSAVLPDGGPAD